MNKLDSKRIIIFLVFAYGIAWLTALVIFLTGGLTNSIPIGIPGLNLAFLLVTTTYMGAPALANILTRLITREGWRDTYLRTNFLHGWVYWLACWFLPGIFIIAGAALFFAMYPQFFDPELGVLKQMLMNNAGGQIPPAFNLWTIVITQTAIGILIAPLVNALPILGEEFGWRAYLQPKLLPLGKRTTFLLMGIIWGIWHAPIIAMGHNFGVDYPGAPWLGILAMTWFCLIFGTFIGWASLRAGSVWPAVIGHGALNGLAGVSMLVLQGHPNLLLGPTPVGVIGSLGFVVLAIIIIIFSRDQISEIPPATSSPDSAP